MISVKTGESLENIQAVSDCKRTDFCLSFNLQSGISGEQLSN